MADNSKKIQPPFFILSRRLTVICHGPWYQCDCVSPYEGTHCDAQSDSCDPDPCENSGVCSNTLIEPDFYECTCSVPFKGKTCSDFDDTCSPNPCKNGGLCKDASLVETVPFYSCDCPDPFTGTQCGKTRKKGRIREIGFQGHNGLKQCFFFAFFHSVRYHMLCHIRQL